MRMTSPPYRPSRGGRLRLVLGFMLAALLTLVVLLPLAHLPISLPLVTSIQRHATSAQTTLPTPRPALSRDERASRALHVEGNQLRTRDGQVVTLRGVNRDGTDFLCAEGLNIFDGPVDAPSIIALQNWHINAVRLLLNEGCWLALGALNPTYSGAAYQRAIHDYVDALTSQGIYVILDLHKNAAGDAVNTHTLQVMPDADHSPDFWRSVATAFADDGMALFDLFNEPQGVGWDCWRDGGQCVGASYRVPGMQTLVNAVRSTGARNVVLLGGLNWANDMRRWLASLPSDPAGEIAASWHVYPHDSVCGALSCYSQMLMPLLSRVPVVVTEFGAGLFDTYCATDGLLTLLSWLDAHAASGYLAFTWNTGAPDCGSLALIRSYNGAPKAPFGVFYRGYLLGLPAQ